MEYLILGFALLAILHFVYEGILAPSYRVEYAYQVFRLRDALRLLKIKQARAIADKPFTYMQDSMNGIVRNIENIDGVMLVECMHKIHHDKEFRARNEERVKVIDSCQHPEAKQLRARSARIIERILTVNNGAWMFYLVPIAIAWVCYAKTAYMIKCVAAMSEPDLDKVTHAAVKPHPMKLAA
jgi:hypothetical protein